MLPIFIWILVPKS